MVRLSKWMADEQGLEKKKAKFIKNNDGYKPTQK